MLAIREILDRAGTDAPPSSLRLRAGLETIEPGGKEGRVEVAEGKRGGAQRVGLQRRPGPQVGRGLDDHHQAGRTSRAESELAIGGVEEIGNGDRRAQNWHNRPSGGTHCVAAGTEGCVRWQSKSGQWSSAGLSGR